MTMIHYTAKVKSSLLLELPTQAEELHLKPGDKVEVRLAPPAESQKVDKKNRSTVKLEAMKPKQLQGRGMLAAILSSEDFMRRKQEEIALEDRPRQ